MLKKVLVLGCVLMWSGCSQDGGQVGQPCILADELNPRFSGFSSRETNIESFPGSDGLVCLANGFHGRVSCPYGQTASDIATLPTESPRRCRVPDAAGNITEVPVEVPVEPQYVDRLAKHAAHYSCRCDGRDAGDYCECPGDMACVPLIEGSSEVAGSYCVKREYNPDAPAGAACDASSADPATDCGNDRGNP